MALTGNRVPSPHVATDIATVASKQPFDRCWSKIGSLCFAVACTKVTPVANSRAADHRS